MVVFEARPRMKKVAGLLILLLSAAAWAGDRSNEIDRVENAATVLDEIMGARDAGIPSRVLDNAKCVAVVPSLLKGGFVIGAAYGRGVASCRTDKGWTAPAFFVMEGGSFGFQIGGQAVDLVMLVMNDHGMKNLLNSKFKLGADASVAAGPVGRQAEGSTDLTFRAEILTYSRARGVFAGVSLNGASVRQDRDSTRDFYGRMVNYRNLLNGSMASPEDAQPWITALNRYAGGSGPITPAAASTRPVPPPPPAPAKSQPAESDIPAEPTASADQPQQ
jgi:SH3 domain-containing YSC84-like protein 1